MVYDTGTLQGLWQKSGVQGQSEEEALSVKQEFYQLMWV